MKELGGIRVDIDSIGDVDVLPETLDLLDDFGVKATFFVAMGPDRTGKNLFKYLKNPRVLGGVKPMRFGIGNLMRGIVSPVCMEDYKDELYEIKKRGHEIGLHGYDHYQWIKTEGEKAASLIEKGCSLFEDVFKCAPRSFASPGFTMNREMLSKVREFDYSSDIIDRGPLYPRIIGREFGTLQVPVSMKSIGEFEVDGLSNSEILKKYQTGIEKNGFFTFYFHPSYEVKYRLKLIKKIIEILKEKKEVLTFAEIAKLWKNENSANL